MFELWQQALQPFNLPLTVALGLVLLFWAVALLGFVGIDTFDVDVTPDVLDADALSVPSILDKLTNAADIPITIVISLFTLFLWVASVMGNFYLNPSQSNLIALAILGGGIVAAVALTKIFTQPLVPLMRKMKAAEKVPPVIGQSGVVRSLEVDGMYGQVLVEREGGAPALLLCRTAEGAAPIPRGTEVLVIDHDDAMDRYIVRSISASAIAFESTAISSGEESISPISEITEKESPSHPI